MAEFDPRTEVTDKIYRVEPSLLGVPLARPWRRAVAIGVDGAAIVVLANAPSVIFGMAATYVLLRASRKGKTGGVLRRSVRTMTRAAAAVMVFVVAVALWNIVDGPSQSQRQISAALGDSTRVLSGRTGLLASSEIVAFSFSDDEVEARRTGEAVARRLTAAGFGENEISDLLVEIGESRAENPWVRAVADSIAESIRGESAPLSADSATVAVAGAEEAASVDAMISAYAAAIAAEDSAGAVILRGGLAPRLAADTLAALEAALQRERAQADELAERLVETTEDLEEAREVGGVLAWSRNVSEDLGLGLGWSGLYFTAFVVFWRGRTPGKRLMGIRVVRLDGVPISWWASFERFGGYAAGFATGLLGFLQVFWDPNRQAVQDKMSGTVVIQEPPSTRNQ